VGDHEPARRTGDDVEFDEVDAGLDRGAKRGQRVLGGQRRRTPVANPAGSVIALERRNGRVGR